MFKTVLDAVHNDIVKDMKEEGFEIKDQWISQLFGKLSQTTAPKIRDKFFGGPRIIEMGVAQAA
jgi:hypothetical protein